MEIISNGYNVKWDVQKTGFDFKLDFYEVVFFTEVKIKQLVN